MIQYISTLLSDRFKTIFIGSWLRWLLFICFKKINCASYKLLFVLFVFLLFLRVTLIVVMIITKKINLLIFFIKIWRKDVKIRCMALFKSIFSLFSKQISFRWYFRFGLGLNLWYFFHKIFLLYLLMKLELLDIVFELIFILKYNVSLLFLVIIHSLYIPIECIKTIFFCFFQHSLQILISWILLRLFIRYTSLNVKAWAVIQSIIIKIWYLSNIPWSVLLELLIWLLFGRGQFWFIE